MPTKTEIIDSAVNWAVDVANDNSHGYDQNHRQGPDFDCSSLVCNAYQQAGLPIKENGGTYTGNMKRAFEACGFKAIEARKQLPLLLKGDVLLNEKHHTALVIGGGKLVQASINEKGTTTGGKTGDQTGREINISPVYVPSYKWDYVLRLQEGQEVRTVEITMTELRAGAQGAEVTLLQVLLNELGYKGKNGKTLTVDGWLKAGGNTEYALKLAQQAYGLSPDGVCGKKTWTCFLHARYS